MLFKSQYINVHSIFIYLFIFTLGGLKSPQWNVFVFFFSLSVFGVLEEQCFRMKMRIQIHIITFDLKNGIGEAVGISNVTWTMLLMKFGSTLNMTVLAFQSISTSTYICRHTCIYMTPKIVFYLKVNHVGIHFSSLFYRFMQFRARSDSQISMTQVL